jgi:putative transposase
LHTIDGGFSTATSPGIQVACGSRNRLREAFPYDTASNYLIFDHAANFNEEVISTVKSFGITPKQTNFRSPWQNGVAERWVGNCRRDLLDHASF